MLIVEIDNPQFITNRGFVLHTESGEVLNFEKDEPLSVRKTEDGRVFVGNRGDVVEIVSKTGLSDLLACIEPATFDLMEDEAGDPCIMPKLLESKVTNDDKIARMSLISEMPDAIIHPLRKLRTTS